MGDAHTLDAHTLGGPRETQLANALIQAIESEASAARCEGEMKMHTIRAQRYRELHKALAAAHPAPATSAVPPAAPESISAKPLAPPAEPQPGDCAQGCKRKEWDGCRSKFCGSCCFHEHTSGCKPVPMQRRGAHPVSRPGVAQKAPAGARPTTGGKNPAIVAAMRAGKRPYAPTTVQPHNAVQPPHNAVQPPPNVSGFYDDELSD